MIEVISITQQVTEITSICRTQLNSEAYPYFVLQQANLLQEHVEWE
jgi:hypothetical protein